MMSRVNIASLLGLTSAPPGEIQGRCPRNATAAVHYDPPGNIYGNASYVYVSVTPRVTLM